MIGPETQVVLHDHREEETCNECCVEVPRASERVMPSDDELRAIYPEVDAFARRMRTELWANRGKGDQRGWRSMTIRQAWQEIAWHHAKMAGAIKSEDIALMRELAADVANGAMMFDDILLTMISTFTPAHTDERTT